MKSLYRFAGLVFGLTVLFAGTNIAAGAEKGSKSHKLEIDVVPESPDIYQEIEVKYLADTTITSLEVPAWGELTLLKKQGPSTQTSLSSINGKTVTTRYTYYSFFVRANRSGKISIPGTTALIGGKTYTCSGKTITVRPPVAIEKVRCRLSYDTSNSLRYGTYVLKLSCDHTPDRSAPLLYVNGSAVEPCYISKSAETKIVAGKKQMTENYEMLYKIEQRSTYRYSCIPQLTFGGTIYRMKPFTMSITPPRWDWMQSVILEPLMTSTEAGSVLPPAKR